MNEELQKKIDWLIKEHFRTNQKLINNLTSLIYEYVKENPSSQA